jgi:hypothetical protein
LEGSAIKKRDKERALAEVKKTYKKSRSEKHIQKNKVIYKRKAQQQILKRMVKKQTYLNNIINIKIQHKVTAINKEYKK